MRIPLSPTAADRLRGYESLIMEASASRELYARGVVDALGIEGAIEGFDEVTGELIVADPESTPGLGQEASGS